MHSWFYTLTCMETPTTDVFETMALRPSIAPEAEKAQQLLHCDDIMMTCMYELPGYSEDNEAPLSNQV